MKIIPLYPAGKIKALTFSYDDGVRFALAGLSRTVRGLIYRQRGRRIALCAPMCKNFF